MPPPPSSVMRSKRKPPVSKQKLVAMSPAVGFRVALPLRLWGSWPLSLCNGIALGTQDIVDHIRPDLLEHARALFNGFGDGTGGLFDHALVVDLVAVGHVGYGRGGVDMCAISGNGVDLRQHHLSRSMMSTRKNQCIHKPHSRWGEKQAHVPVLPAR